MQNYMCTKIKWLFQTLLNVTLYERHYEPEDRDIKIEALMLYMDLI